MIFVTPRRPNRLILPEIEMKIRDETAWSVSNFDYVQHLFWTFRSKQGTTTYRECVPQRRGESFKNPEDIALKFHGSVRWVSTRLFDCFLHEKQRRVTLNRVGQRCRNKDGVSSLKLQFPAAGAALSPLSYGRHRKLLWSLAASTLFCGASRCNQVGRKSRAINCFSFGGHFVLWKGFEATLPAGCFNFDLLLSVPHSFQSSFSICLEYSASSRLSYRIND